MGAYNSTYVGVFLEASIVTKQVEKEILKNSSGKIFTTGKFDPETGEKLIIEKVYENKKIYPTPYFEKDGIDDDTFWAPEYHGNSRNVKYFLINEYNKFHQKIEECETLEFTDLNILSIIDEFKKEYSEYLDHYKKIGYDFKIKWGIVNYAN
jgi:hypothetical protein